MLGEEGIKCMGLLSRVSMTVGLGVLYAYGPKPKTATEIRRITITGGTTIAPASLDVALLFASRSPREWRKVDIVKVIPWDLSASTKIKADSASPRSSSSGSCGGVSWLLIDYGITFVP
jgi:hypothetical protein